MEIYLVKDQVADFDEDYDGGWKDDVERTTVPVPVILEPVVQGCDVSKEYCKEVAKLLIGIGNSNNAQSVDGSKIDYSVRATLTVPNSTMGFGLLEIRSAEDEDRSNSVFERLIRVFKKENLSFNLKVKDLEMKYSCGCTELVQVEAYDLRIEAWQIHLFSDKIKFPKHAHLIPVTLDGGKTLRCRFTVTVKVNEKALITRPVEVEDLLKNRVAVKNKMLLDEAVGSDLVVVAANGVEVKCHKSFLMVNSAVFRAMFENKVKEETPNRLELEDMSEEAVRAFLNFLYCCDVKAARDKCDVALELFRAAEKYGISSLKSAMKSLICFQEVEWFNVDMAVGLALFVQDLEKKEEMLRKAAQVLKWYSKNKSTDLLNSEKYQKLFQNNPQVGMKIVRLFLEFS